jgi:hypothetical protein
VWSVGEKLDQIGPAQKTLLFDLDTLGIPLDNVEGMTLGPTLPDGRRALVLVSDNNFATSQFTQFLLFALGKWSRQGGRPPARIDRRLLAGRDRETRLRNPELLGGCDCSAVTLSADLEYRCVIAAP